MKKYIHQEYLILAGLETETIRALQDEKAIIAGGAVRAVFAGERIYDYDIYPPSQESLTKIKKYLDDKFDFVFKSETAISYKKDSVKIQIITINDYFGKTVEEIISSFDFTICMGAYDVFNRKFILGDTFLEDVAMRKLVFNEKAEFPIASLYRTKKYVARGYSISGVEMIKLALCIHNLKIDSYTDLRKQLMGIDTMFLSELTDTLISNEYAEKKYQLSEIISLLDTAELDKLQEQVEN
jgi:hypothetical protein